MRHKSFLYILTVLLIAGMLAQGCGKKTDPASESTASSEAESSAEPEASQPEDETPPDPDAFTEEEADLPYGEAENTYVGEIIETKDDAESMTAGEAYPVPAGQDGSNARYTIAVDGIELTEDRNEFEETQPDAVVKVIYTVTNNTEEDGVLVASLSFRMMDENNATLGEYFLNPEQDPRADVLPVEKGQTATFVIAYSVTGHPKALTLVFDDFFLSTGTQYTFSADPALIEALS